MLLLMLALTLSDSRQAAHDKTEWQMYQRIESDKRTLEDLWRPSAKLLRDYEKVRSCYVQFHLYRTKDCDAALAQFEVDLGQVEMVQAAR